MENLKGFKTVLMGGALMILPVASEYLAGVDWSFLGPVGGLFVGGMVMTIMRVLTTTAVGAKD